ncbi:hypothetical protein N2152v2_003014 [Parachlorella kessleri]
MIPWNVVAARQVIPYCYDTVTRLPEVLPLATPRPTDCTKPVVVDIASTLLQYGIRYGILDSAQVPLTEAILKMALNLSSSTTIGQFNAIAASKSSESAMRAIGPQSLKAQGALRNTLNTVIRCFTRKSDKLVEVSMMVLRTLAQYIMDSRQSRARSARRLLQSSDAPLDLTSMTQIQTILTAMQTTIQQAVTAGTFDATDIQQVNSDILAAISNAIANINIVAQTATSYEDVQKATQVALTTLSDGVQTLLGGGSLAAFTASTSVDSLMSVVSSTTLVGDLVTPSPSPSPTASPTWTSINIPQATNRSSLTVTFAAADYTGAPVQIFNCRQRAIALVGGSSYTGQWQSCTSPMTISGLQEGRWGLSLLAIDAAGAENETAEQSFWVALTAPTAPVSSGPSAGSTVMTNSVTFGLTPVVSPTAAAISTCETMLVAVTQAQFATVTSASTLSLPTSSDSPPALTGAAQALGADLGRSEAPSALRKLLSADSPTTTDSANPVVTAGSVLDSWLAATGSIAYQGLADGYFVFKVYAIDIAGNIGPIAATPFRVDTGSGSDRSKKKRIVIGVVAGVGGGLLLGIVCFTWWWLRRRSQVNSSVPANAAPLLDGDAHYASETPEYHQPPYAAPGLLDRSD